MTVRGGQDRRWRPWLRFGLAVAGIGLILVAEPLTRVAARLLPLAAKVTSAGTQYPGFQDAFPTILRGLGVSALVAVALAPIVAEVRLGERAYRVALSAVAGATATIYGWLAYPHNGFPSNSRIHWVDIFYDRIDDYFYTLVKLPHALFYSVPWLLQALNGGVNVVLTAWVVQRLTGRRGVALAAASSYAVSSQLLRFADSAEDLQLTVSALLCVVIAYSTRRPVWTAVAMFVAVLARPPFLLAVPAFAFAELVTAGNAADDLRDRLRAAVTNRFMWASLATFLALFTAWHVGLHLLAEPWFLTEGRIIDRGTLDVMPREIEGYTISAFDGVYFGHLAWLVPLPVWVAIATVTVRFRRLDEATSRFFVFAATFVLGTLLMNEAIVVLYFNIRYATYAFPFLLLIAWLVPVVIDHRDRITVTAGALVLIGSFAAPPHIEFSVRERVTSHPIAQATPDGHHLRQLTDGFAISTTFDRRAEINYLAYLFRRPFGAIEQLVDDERPTSGVVATDDPQRFGGTTLYASEGFHVILLGKGDGW